MNTLCKICGHVDLQGHHKCDPEGDPVRVSVTTPGVLRMDMLEHYGRTPSSPETVVKVSPRPVDSAVRRIPMAIETLILGDQVYGGYIEVRNLTAAGAKRISRWAKRVNQQYDRDLNASIAAWPVHDGYYVAPREGRNV